MAVPAPQFKGAGSRDWRKTVKTTITYLPNGTPSVSRPTSVYGFRKKSYTKGPYTPGKGYITPLSYSSLASYCTSYSYDWSVRPKAGSYRINFAGESGFGYTGGNNSGVHPLVVDPGYHYTWPGYSSDFANESLTEARANASNSKVNLLTTAFEARESATTLTSLVMGAAAILLGIKKGKPKMIRQGLLMVSSGATRTYNSSLAKGVTKGAAATAAGHASDTWLNWSYGWKPLLSDIFGLLELFRDGLDKPGHHFSSMGYGRQGWSGEIGPDSTPYVTVFDRSDATIFSARSKYYWRVKNGWSHAATGLGLTNPALLAWELVPFSFVVDWLVPIGTFLESLTSPIGLVFTGGYLSERAERKSTYSFAGAFPYLLESVGSPTKGERRSLSLLRYAVSSPPITGLYVKNPFSSNHTASALALLYNLRK